MLTRWAPILKTVELLPSSKGRFEVSVDDQLVFSKATLGRHAHPGEVVALIGERLGPPVMSTD